MIQSSKITFKNNQSTTLSAQLDTPLIVPVRAYALFAHCFSCSKDIAVATRISKALAKKGIATLRFDFTGLGQSDGEFSRTTFSSNLDDLLSAVAYLEKNHQRPILLIGHSLGGTAALASAHKIPGLKGLVTIGSPSSPAHISTHLKKQDDAYVFDLGQKPFTLCKSFVSDIQNFKIEDHLPKHKLDTLIMHSPQDTIVNIEHAQNLYLKLKHPKSFISLDQADHLLSKKSDALHVAHMIASWFDRHLPELEIPEHKELLVSDVKQSLTQVIRTGQHTLIADEPLSLGGKNLGPNPYDLLLSALGACTSMTLRMYARHKKMDLQSIEVSLTHEKIYAKDCDSCTTENGKIDLIKRKIKITGNLSSEQKIRLLEIADRCPVHRSLESENKITSQLIE